MTEKEGKPIFEKRTNAVFICAATLMLCLGVVFLQGCSPQQSSASDSQEQGADDDSAVVTLTEWTFDTDCSACHAAEGESSEDSACTASKHASLKCADCHADAESLAQVHEGASTNDRMPSRLKKTEVDSSTCLDCHDQEEIAEESSECTALTDSNGTVVNPHDLPSTETHDQIVCTDCHTMHEEQTDVQGDAKAYCLSCHHADVFECYTCHEHS